MGYVLLEKNESFQLNKKLYRLTCLSLATYVLDDGPERSFSYYTTLKIEKDTLIKNKGKSIITLIW